MRAFVCLGLLPVVDRTHDNNASSFSAALRNSDICTFDQNLQKSYKMNDDLKCAQCRKVGDGKLLTCGGCGNVKYCSKEHQVSKSGWTKNWASG